MKQRLKEIYEDLSKGKLTQKDALEKIKALKQDSKNAGVLLSAQVWEQSQVIATSASDKSEYAEKHILLCELGNVDVKQLGTLTTESSFISWKAAADKNVAESYCDFALTCFEKLQSIIKSKPQGKVLVQICIANSAELELFIGISGLLKTATLENPQLLGQVILSGPQSSTEELAEQLVACQSKPNDKIIKYHQGARSVLSWKEIEEFNETESSAISFKDQGVYLITGGLGGLGVLFAKEIIKQTSNAKIILVGRSKLTSEKKKTFESLKAKRKTIEYRQLDIADIDQVKQLVAIIKNEFKQLNGIIHSAGVIVDNFILKKSSREFKEVLTPKVFGTFNLDQATQEVDLDFLVLFSSMASAIGNIGQADYAAGNGFMDQFASYRNQLTESKQRIGKTLSVNWPLWQEGGMVLDQATQDMLEQTMGLRSIPSATGMTAFYRSLKLQYAQTLILKGDISKIRNSLFNDVAIQTETSKNIIEGSSVEQSINSGNLLEKTQDLIKKQLSELLKVPSHKIDPTAPLERYGIDSILAVSLTNQLEKTFGALSKTLFFEYQTIGELAEYFINAHSPKLNSIFNTIESSPKKVIAPLPTPKSQTQTRAISGRRFSSQAQASASANPTTSVNMEPIAIIGLSGRFPESVNLYEYWNNLRNGKDCIIEVPQDRWDWREYYSEDRNKSGHHYSKWGGFISGVDEFDPRFFNISPKEAATIDPQERLFLQHCWMAIEDAGYTRASLQIPCDQDLAGQVGVYVGVMYGEYQLFGAEVSAKGKRMGIPGSYASISNRVSYVLNLHGPSMTVDTMCSSSLTAIHLACQDLKLGRTSLAIAGGVNVTVHPNKYLVLSGGQFISSDGHCQSFGEGGDGYIPGEGVGAVILKRLSEAERDGDHIYGIIKGSILNHGGKTNGYSVPNPQAQASVISRALAESNINPRHISYIEAHGTGTKLGDPIEIAALSKSFQQYTKDTGFCLIGSAKSNIGHCESAAGIAGLAKVLLQMQNREIVPSLHSAKLNPHIDFEKTPFVVNQTLKPWNQPVIDGDEIPRIAGISSFGAGGSNAHIIIQEYASSKEANYSKGSDEIGNVLIALSARTEEQLKHKANDLLSFVQATRPELAAMAYTLQVGREAMEERLGFLVSSVDQLIDKLKAYINGVQNIEDTYQGQVKRNKEALSLFSTDTDLQQTVGKWISEKKLSKLLDLWVKGLELDWNKLYDGNKPNRISLPTYPFAKEKYWVDTKVGSQSVSYISKAAVLHPLLHINTSNLIEQSYSSTFNGKEFFLQEFELNDGTLQKILSPAAYLEMARIAVEKSLPAQRELNILELRNVVWGETFIYEKNKQISIALFAKENNRIDFEIYSLDKDEAAVHCQGQAVFIPKSMQQKLDVGQLKYQVGQGVNQLLSEIKLPVNLENSNNEYVLHPSQMHTALQLAGGLIDGGQSAIPFSVEAISVVAACTKEMIAWVRYSKGNQAENAAAKLNIDLCDQQGNVCVLIHGISYQVETSNTKAPVVSQTVSYTKANEPKQVSIDHKVSEPRKIFIGETLAQTFPDIDLRKPSEISIVSLDELSLEKRESGSITKASVSLSNTVFGSFESIASQNASSSVSLFDLGNGIFSIQIAGANNNTLSQDLTNELIQALTAVQKEPMVKVLILKGTEHSFLRGGRAEYNYAIEQKLFQVITSFPYPVIAEMQGEATGVGFLVGALCDFMICSRDSNYYYTSTQDQIYPTVSECQFFEERFGKARAKDFLYLSIASTGSQLIDKGWTCAILSPGQVEANAQKLAASLAKKSEASLRLLKQHLSNSVLVKAEVLAMVDPLADESQLDMANSNIISPAKYIELESHKDNVLIIKMCVGGKEYGLKALVADLRKIFSQVKNSQYKSIVLVSEHSDFLLGTAEELAVNDVLDFENLVLESQIPVIAVLHSNTNGVAWLLSLFCDACVYNKNAIYSASNIWQNSDIARQAGVLFSEQFESYSWKQILLTGKEYSGLELKQLSGTTHISENGNILTDALRIAEHWAALPLNTLLSWKKERALSVREKIKSLPTWSVSKDETSEALSIEPTSIALKSKVISATAHPEGILVVKMEDREAKNMFSESFIEGMNEVFAHIEATSTYKVIVLTGYDNYFASGGTKETLLAIQEGKTKFTDNRIYQIAVACKIPVIAAMQGHGIGAGWALGMFADFVLFSEESRYFSPYMNYGFTPGAGATFIFPEKIGHDLSRETLMTAQEYAGKELKERGLFMSVLPKEQVSSAALDLARQIANRSRSSLVAFKHQQTQHLYAPLEETYKRELAMHEKTFVGQFDTLKQINDNFYQGNDSKTEVSQLALPTSIRDKVHSAVAVPSLGKDNLTYVTTSLRQLLAQELHLQEHEIDENMQFVDLGLDSITGVTWIRKINEKYNTSIEATKIYSYPTLTKLSQYVKEEAENAGSISSGSEVISSGISLSNIDPQGNILIEEITHSSDNLPLVIASLRKLLAQELHLHENEIDENTQFIDLGLDSITGVTWIRKINEKYQTEIEATKIYSYPTLSQLSAFVKEEAEKLGTLTKKSELSIPLNTIPKPQYKPVLPSSGKKLASWRNRSASRQTSSVNSGNLSQPIAVIGMSGQFPQARNVEEFWQNLANGKNCISEVPQKRWDVDKYYQEGNALPGKTNSKWMGLLDEYDLFDPLFFNISPTETESMDPQQRLFLQECWHAIENAGYNPKSLSGAKCGVFVGCANGDYLQLSKKQQLSAQGFTGGATSILGARISYFLNLQGPCLSIDTACSSSLVAIASACDSLNSGNSDLALAGGVVVMATPAMHIMCSQTGMLSTDGKCFSFDQRANGFVPGEGVGVVMLKRLTDAERDQDTILGVIQGWGVNQDGKTNGITAPNSESQTRLEQDVYDKFQIDPSKIQLIEAHGTGTKLGDPIEVDALKAAFKKYTTKKEYCAIGSVKSNIGHCLTAAGVASFIKVLLSIKNRQLPPTINYNKLNEHIGLEGTPFYINDQLQNWEVSDSERRQAAISAFGFSGTNAHIVISEYVSQNTFETPVSAITENGKIIIPLSARTAEQLKQKAIELLEFIKKEAAIDLLEMAYTLQTGREEMGERLGLMVSSIGQLAEKLQAYLDGKEDIEEVYQGQVKRNKEGLSIISRDDDMKRTIVEQWINQKKLSKLLDLWVKGLDIDWQKLYGEAKPKRINLPAYPFAKERYWIEEIDSTQVIEKVNNITVLHPLLHRNTSDLSQQCYSSTFNGEEFFLKDHQVKGEHVLPVMAYVEMVREAITLATTSQIESGDIELHNIVWHEPIFVAGNTEVSIALFASDNGEIEYEIYSTEEGERKIHCEGVAVITNKSSSRKIDIEELKRQVGQGKLEIDALYQTFTNTGIKYGGTFKGLTEVYQGVDQLLVKLKLQDTAENNQYFLHPSLMESVVQACMILTGDSNFIGMTQPSGTLFSISAATASEMYAWIRFAQDGMLDIDLMDLQGNCAVLMRGLALRNDTYDYSRSSGKSSAAMTEDAPEVVMMTPKWELVTNFAEITTANQNGIILLIGADIGQMTLIEKIYSKSKIVNIEIASKDSIDVITEKIKGQAFNRIVWIGSNNPVLTLTEESIIEDQNLGVLQVFKIVKSLMTLGYQEKNLEWDLIVFNSQLVKQNDVVNPTHAGLQGFSGSLAKEFPRWKIRLFDLQEFAENPLSEMSTLPQDTQGASYAYRNKEWFFQKLMLIKDLPQEKLIYRSNGVYVVIGGSGGLGEVWSQHVIEKCQAQVVWIGRREMNNEIQEKLDRLSTCGKRPDYIQANASNLNELQQAYKTIKEKYHNINGVVHTAVGAYDDSLKKVTEEVFQNILSVKVDLTVRIAQVFQNEPLDFVLFFSSNAAFKRAGGTSGYSAGCTFKDTFALQLGKIWPAAVKVINWGYWSIGAGDTVSDSFKNRFFESGQRPIEPNEGMKSLDQLLSGSFNQISIAKIIQSRRSEIVAGDEWISSYENTMPDDNLHNALIRTEAIEPPALFKEVKVRGDEEMELLLSEFLNSIISSTPGIIPFYHRWLDAAKNILTVKGYVNAGQRNVELDYTTYIRDLWNRWEKAKNLWNQDESKKALYILVEKCVHALPEILTGKTKATDIMFPKSSLEMVENVYKNDKVSKAYNECLANAFIASLQARLIDDPNAKIRILEIGAGTGATTVGILEKLRPYQSQIAEYCYTDLSKAFLFHAENNYAPQAPYLRTAIFNVEEPIEGQNISLDEYDFVIAANVLHATKNIRNTLRNTKAVLRNNGILLLNELIERSLYSHLTFGLLEGWWLNEDDAIRIPGAPGLYAESWKEVLEEEGFDLVAFPSKEVNRLGQQIILGVSNGVVRQKQKAGFNKVVMKKEVNVPKAPTPAKTEIKPVINTVKLNDDLLLEKTVVYLKQLIGSVLKISSNQIDASEPLESYGIDSIIIGLVNEQLKKNFSDISSTLLFEYQTINALAKHLIETQKPTLQTQFELDVQPIEERSTNVQPSVQSTIQPSKINSGSAFGRSGRLLSRNAVQTVSSLVQDKGPIAVIGISGLYPEAPNLEKYWENLKSGKNSISEIPNERWSLDEFFEQDEKLAIEQGKSYSKWGGFINEFSEFDALFFGISPRDALNMDPQERLFLQAAWHALENSGYTRGALQNKFNRKVGVFAGVTRPGYNLYGSTQAIREEKFYPHTSFGSVANRLSYFLDINGPSMPIDTMCSSSLTAIHEACEHIHRGDCDLAFVGGVNVYVHPSSYVDMSAQHMFSKDGLCKSFGEGGNGFVPGEGVGVVLLRPLADAIRDNDNIQGVILATNVNHGGKTNGYTVPNPTAQAELIRRAIDKAGINARDISYIEAHGTGTELGDPIEITGLKQAFSKDTQDTGYCKIGSVKSNIGHLEAAAGISGFTKVLLQMKYQQIVPSLHAEKLNPHIDFQKTPFDVNRKLSDWDRPVIDGKEKPRIAGISSFGAGGANAHLIVQEYIPPTEGLTSDVSDQKINVIIPLSARNEEQLKQKAQDLLNFIRTSDLVKNQSLEQATNSIPKIDLVSVAYTLQIAREAMEHRLGFIVNSLSQLAEKLEAYIHGEQHVENMLTGIVKRKSEAISIISQDDDMKEAVDKWISRNKLSKLLDLWVKGLELEWDKLYSDVKPKRISLPGYPFSKERYWIDSLDLNRATDNKLMTNANLESIEDIINRIDNDSIDTEQAIKLLTSLA
ncbi:MAG: SDR family NAD(P)-dependent oxidoreductase [Sporocytophaga sp.]|uniref:SDR family NAD(P)-dependent oxidoreductase n=1 Tax=Sporocytophaga sp. TaxID=2231183 RepID=UPI001B2A3F93|nr:SDR family NAD(P)-dependent oxidoreductase [Sporocytophaga sp.]MBO9699912.1 SDR family NAD(P)-dependent oxidoreductase [Sporocytophaga sp.]